MDFQFLQSLRPNISEYTTVEDDDDDAIAVAEFIVSTPDEQIQKVKTNDPTVTSADFRYKNLRGDQFQELFDGLKTNTHVKEVLLDGNDMTADSFKSLSEAMKSNKSIDTLNVNFTALDDPSAQLLLDALNTRPVPLKALHCLGNKLSPQTERQLVGHVTRVTENSDGFRLAVSRLEAKLTDEESRTALSALTKRLAALEASETKLKSQLSDLQRTASTDSLHVSTSTLSLNAGTSNKDVSLDPSVLKALGRKFIDLNNVQINEKIAETGGSNAGIFACHVDGWLCAMKELDVKQLSDSNIKAFESEIELLENLPYHLNICRYLFHEKTGDKIRLYITKYNCSLRHIVNRKKEELANQKDFKTFSAKHIAKWCVDIASGMAFLHKHQIMHRDLKPDNVFVNLDVHGDVKQCAIGDFDTAKRVSKSQQAKTTVGTYCYMAPEVFRSQNMATYSFAIDVWSFGMLMYELLALKQPYEDEDAFDVPQFVVSGKRPQLPSLHESYNELIQIFKECTEVSPEVRPNMETLRDKLMRLHWSQTA